MPTGKSRRRRNAVIGGTAGTVLGGVSGGLIGQAFDDRQTLGVLRDTKNHYKKEAKSFRASMTPKDQRALKVAQVKAHTKSPLASMKTQAAGAKRYAKLRRGSIAGAALGGAWLGTGMAVDSYTRTVGKSAQPVEGNPMTYSAFGVHHPEASLSKALMPIAPAAPAAKPDMTKTKAAMGAQKMAPQATSALASAPGQMKKTTPMPLAKRMMECVDCGKKANCDKSGCCAGCAKEIKKAFGLKPLKALGMKASTASLNAGAKFTARGNSAFGLRAGHLGAAQQQMRRGAGKTLTAMGNNPGKTAAIATGAAGLAAANKPKKNKGFYY